MEMVVLSIHLLVCICLIGLVLLQRSEGGALGMGGGSGSLMSGRGAADALARMTSIAGGFFLVTSLGLTVISGATASTQERSVFDLLPHQQQSAPVTPAPLPVEPARPDPTESSVGADTQLASLDAQAAVAPPPVAVAPPPAAAAERAAPLQPQTASLQPQTRPQPVTRQPAAATQSPVRTATQPASTATTSSAPRVAAPPPAQPRSQPAAATPRPAAPRTTAPRTTTPLILPNTSGAASDPTQAPPTESVDATGGVEAVRRERAGPDQ